MCIKSNFYGSILILTDYILQKNTPKQATAGKKPKCEGKM